MVWDKELNDQLEKQNQNTTSKLKELKTEIAAFNNKLNYSIKWEKTASEELIQVGATCKAIEVAIKEKHDDLTEKSQRP